MSMDTAILVTTLVGNIVGIALLLLISLVLIVSIIWVSSRINKYAREHYCQSGNK